MTPLDIGNLPPHIRQRIEDGRRAHGLTPDGALPPDRKTMQLQPQDLEDLARAFDDYAATVTSLITKATLIGDVNHYSNCIEGIDTHRNITDSLHSKEFGLVAALEARYHSAVSIANMLRISKKAVEDVDGS